jgi:5'-3' exonuclease
MGIPAYYKNLTKTIPQLVVKNLSHSIDWFFMDFNCLIYHCISMTPDYSSATHATWETQLIQNVVTYTLQIIKHVNPKGVYLAIDGVVPMAKMKQQRMRRFKSAWLSKQESCADKWDTNAITPGTGFMQKLHTALESIMLPHWTLSTSNEPGEGEHKIMREWRKGTYEGNYVVYGMDADLIVLSLLGMKEHPVWLFREDMSPDADGGFEWFSIRALKDWLCAEFDTELHRTFIMNYCFAMSFLGNDFVPSALGLKMRENGHTDLLRLLRLFTYNGICLVHPETLEIQGESVFLLCKELARDEATRIRSYILKKQSMIYGGYMDTGITVVEEDILMQWKQLIPSWPSKYMTRFFTGFDDTLKNRRRIADEYLYGIQWIWSYYTGRMENICYNWYYPFSLPPLWEWLSAVPVLPAFPRPIRVRAEDIRPVEQLCIVLPVESWSLLPKSKERRLPVLAPQYFPSRFSFDSVGKHFFWECEAMIPIPSVTVVKDLMRSL